MRLSSGDASGKALKVQRFGRTNHVFGFFTANPMKSTSHADFFAVLF
jgi:hypothetical protein